MPDKPMTFCKWKGCDELASGRYCPQHTIEFSRQKSEDDKAYEQFRGSASARGYDRRWRDVRIKYLRAHPICERCRDRGRIAAAQLVHHIHPINEGGAKYDLKNMQALCNECHEAIHGKDRWKPRADNPAADPPRVRRWREGGVESL